MLPIHEDTSDLVFRVLFSTIFIGLGVEHLVSDTLLQTLMPDWLGPKRLASLASGGILLAGGLSIALGYKVDVGATVLAGFLVLVTAIVHAPGLVGAPPPRAEGCAWLWQVYQRSNFVKNICLFGVCIHLVTHRTGRHSLDAYLRRRAARRGRVG